MIIMNVRVLIFLVFCAFIFYRVTGISRIEYCRLNRRHTMCLFEEVAHDCLPSKTSGVKPEEIKQIVNFHNKMRRIIANGEELRGNPGPQPEAANMRKLSWDKEVEIVAQRWADQCEIGRDKFRDIHRFSLGQNIFASSKEHNINSWPEVIQKWYDEIANLDNRLLDLYPAKNNTENVANMIWHSAYAIGCGRRSFNLYSLYVCNYGPNKVAANGTVYLEGEPCSKCPRSYYCQNGLCVNKNSSYTSREYKILPEKFSLLLNTAN